MNHTTYRQQVQRLIQDVSEAKFSPIDIDLYVNMARRQIAGEAACVRIYGGLTLVVGQRVYPFSSITYGGALGINTVNNVRQIWFRTFGTTGQTIVNPREFEWFGLYHLNVDVPTSGPPTDWAQLGQGQNGTIFIDPLPDNTYVCVLDLTAGPADIATDADPEAIPQLWQDAVPFYAAYIALLTKGNNDGAQNMFQLFEMFMARARAAATPSVLPHQYAEMPRQQDTAQTTAPVRRIGIN